jgi:hypothetical protein
MAKDYSTGQTIGLKINRFGSTVTGFPEQGRESGSLLHIETRDRNLQYFALFKA